MSVEATVVDSRTGEDVLTLDHLASAVSSSLDDPRFKQTDTRPQSLDHEKKMKASWCHDRHDTCPIHPPLLPLLDLATGGRLGLADEVLEPADVGALDVIDLLAALVREEGRHRLDAHLLRDLLCRRQPMRSANEGRRSNWNRETGAYVLGVDVDFVEVDLGQSSARRLEHGRDHAAAVADQA